MRITKAAQHRPLDLVRAAGFRLCRMRRFRVWTLVLLAVLLPVRGAMAAAMLCAPSVPGVTTQVTPDPADPHGSGHTHHDHAQHGHGAAGAHDHAPASQDKCNLCSATCSLTPLVNHIAGVHAPCDLRTASFPELDAPAPSFVSGGQERPPRTI